MQKKIIGTGLGAILVIGIVVFAMSRPSVAPDNGNVNLSSTNTLTNQVPARSFTTDVNTPATNTSNQTTNTSNNTGSTLTISITSAGLNPKSVTISDGTVIVLTNNDSVLRQISSNPHPAHTDLPGFDLTIAPGSTRSFTFTQIGSWGYHDHNSPFDSKFHGVVKVQ